VYRYSMTWKWNLPMSQGSVILRPMTQFSSDIFMPSSPASFLSRSLWLCRNGICAAGSIFSSSSSLIFREVSNPIICCAAPSLNTECDVCPYVSFPPFFVAARQRFGLPVISCDSCGIVLYYFMSLPWYVFLPPIYIIDTWCIS